MAINWSLLQPVDIGGMFAKGYQQGQEMVQRERAKSALAAFSANPTDPAAQNALAQYSPEFAMRLAGQKQELAMKQAERQRLGSYFSEPDPRMARQRALQSGDIDVAKELGSLDEETRKRAIDEAKALAPFAYEAMKFKTPEERRAYGQSIAPQLATIGITPDELANFDWSDASLNGIVNIGQTLDQRREMDRVRWVTDPARGSFPIDYYGRDVRSTPGSGGGAMSPAPAGQPGDLTSFRDPGYDTIEAKIEAKYPQLPKGLLARIRTQGERSNANQVSSAGAQTVYQVIPDTRAAFQQKYGVDAYASPEAAAEVAALHLIESMQRGEDPVRGYIGGPDQSRWGPQTEAYAGRVGPAGPVQQGNIDLTSRPRVNNADGTFSTLRSISIGTDQGEVLIPTIAPDGRQMSQEEAIAEYRRSGKHLGIFRTPEEATDAAKAISEAQEAIAAGAPADQVRAELAKYGVRL